MLSFQPYSMDSLKAALPYIRKCPYLCNDLSAGTFFIWHENTDLRFCVWHDTFMVRQDVGEQPAFSYPYGADPDGMLDELMAYVRENGLALRFFALDGETLARVRADARFPRVMSAHEDRWSDYIYSFEDAATFRGKKFSGQRNHINKFTKLYGEPQARFLRAEDRPLLHEMLREYEEEHRDGNALERIELRRAGQLLDHYGELGLPAACLTVEGQIAAFTIGEIVGDMLIIHVEKALRRYEGAYPAMYQGFVKLVWEMLGRPLRLVNREDDSGDPGLRTSKMQYQPIFMVDKHLAHVDSPAARLDAMPVLDAGGAALTPFRPEDRAAYLRMNTDADNNRWWGYDYREDVNITGPVDEDTFYDSTMYDMRAGDSINFAVRLTQDGPMIGEVILWRFASDGSAELGCRLLPEYQGRGIGRAAFCAAADFAERTLGLSVRARCHLENLASYRMITGSGFQATHQDGEYYYFTR